MRIALLSDIHSNLESLTSVLNELNKIGYDELICLGDIIGYGPDPEACLDIVFNKAKIILMGNHEQALLKPELLNDFNTYARESLLWTSVNISEKSTKLLSYLKIEHYYDSIMFVHSNPLYPENWDYIANYYDARRYFDEMKCNLCFIGHSHIEGVYKMNKKSELNKDNKSIINVGSVGQPRDRMTTASFGVFDIDKWAYTNYRVEYDVEKTYKKIIEKKLPSFLAERLLKGI
jgi:predicted phosphodiesterase